MPEDVSWADLAANGGVWQVRVRSSRTSIPVNPHKSWRRQLYRAVVFYSLLLVSAVMFGQTGTAVFLGTATDQQGALLPGVKITATNVDTGISVGVITDAGGFYRIPGLFPGVYDLQAERARFAVEIRRRVVLTVSQEAVVNFTLKVGQVAEKIEVSGQAPLVESTDSAVSGLVDPTQMRELPLNGRDIFQLVLLQPGVEPTPNAGPSPWQKGGLAKVAVNGQRPTANNLTIDGMDANDPAFNVSPGGASGVLLGVDALEEFRVFTSTYAAEYGRNAGSIIQTVTKSGTNRLHGSLFEFLRNSALDAKNYFDLADKAIPPFQRNQFGGSLGGPIQRDQTFFFVSYEGFRERLGITAVANVPDALAHQGLLPSGAPNPPPCTEQNPGGCVNVGINPGVLPFLALAPTPNGPDLGGGVGVYTSSDKRATREDYGLVRIDHAFSPTHSVFGRYIMDDSDSRNPYLSTLVPGFPGESSSRDQFVTLQDQRVFHTDWLNLLAFGFNRTTYLAVVHDTHPGLTIALAPNRPLGVLAITGLTSLGNNFIYPFGSFSNTFQLQDNFAWQHGRHAIKFGGEYRELGMNGAFDLFVNGQYSFQDLSFFGFPYLSDNPALESFLHGTAYSYIGTNPQLSNSDRGFRQNWLSGYAQDDWRANPRLTLNFGLRWEFYSNPTEASHKEVNIRNVATDTAPTVGKFLADTPKDLFSPRFGLAWQLTPDQKTVLRIGTGVFRDQIWANLYGNARTLPPFFQAYFALLPPFLNPLSGPIPAATTANATMTYYPKFPSTIQYNLNVEHEITRDSVFKLMYVGARGNHLVRLGEANPFNPFLGQYLNPAFGSIIRIVTDAQSFYNSMQGSFEHRTSHGLTLAAHYTWAHSVDDASGAFPSDSVNESGKSQNLFDRKGDRGRSSFDVRNNVVLNFIDELPFGPGKKFGHDASGWTAKVIEGWSVSGIGSFHSNVPFTPVLGFDNAGTRSAVNSDRPNLVGNPYQGNCPNGARVGTVTCWFNPTAYALPFHAFGNAGRNSLAGPDFADFDFAILKNIPFGEDRMVQFRAEIFNIANRPNFAVPTNTEGPNGTGGNGDEVFAQGAGQIFSTVNPSRQIQFGLKIFF